MLWSDLLLSLDVVFMTDLCFVYVMKVILKRRGDVDVWDLSFCSALIKGCGDNWWL